MIQSERISENVGVNEQTYIVELCTMNYTIRNFLVGTDENGLFFKVAPLRRIPGLARASYHRATVGEVSARPFKIE